MAASALVMTAMIGGASMASPQLAAGEPATPTFAVSVAYQGHVYLVGPDGTGRRRLRSAVAAERDESSEPSWSPDGQRLAFIAADSSGGEPPSVRVINVDGTGERRVTAKGVLAITPSFSPDGKRIAFARFTYSGSKPSVRIVVATPAGAGLQTLTRGALDYTPAWSPDGRRIAFTRLIESKGGLDYAVYVMNSNGTGQRLFARDAQYPSWSPDGTRIAFASDRDHYGRSCVDDVDCGFSSDIYVMNVDGAGLRRLTANRANDQAPVWSPDGREIAFTSNRSFRTGQGYEAYVIDSDGGCVRRVTNSSSPTESVAWRPGSGGVPATDCGGALIGAREPLVDTDLSRALRFRSFPLFFLGPTYGGMLLTDGGTFDPDVSDAEQGPVIFTYGDCGLLVARACGHTIDITVESICDRNPLIPGEPESPVEFRRPVYEQRRGALIARYGRRVVDVYAGGSAVEIAGRPTEVGQIVAALRPLRGAPGDAFGPPAFPRSLLQDLQRTRRALKQFGSSMSAARHLHMTRVRVLQRLRLARALQRFGPLRSTNC